MKKIKSILFLALAFGFLASVSLTSCGGKKEEATEQTEGEQPSDEAGAEHPAEDGEHPAGGEHPASDTTAAH